MSQTSPNPADQTATSSYATNEYDIKPLSNSGSVSEDASFIDNTVPPEPMSTSQRLKYQGSSGVMVISEANQKSKLTIWRGNYRN